MPTINFPSGPSLNDSYNLGTRTWKWNGEAWALQPLTGGFTGSAGASGYTGSAGAGGSSGAIGYTGSTGASAVDGTTERFTYTISGTPTTVSGNDNSGNTLAYDSGLIDVFLNGIKMVNGTDVTVTSGTSVVFASSLTSGDVVDITTFGVFNITGMNASNLSSGTVPEARLPVTTFMTNVLNDLSTIALRSATTENAIAYNTNSSFVDVFQDSSGIASHTTSARNASEYVSSISTGLATADAGGTEIALVDANTRWSSGGGNYNYSGGLGISGSYNYNYLSTSDNKGSSHTPDSSDALNTGNTKIYFSGVDVNVGGTDSGTNNDYYMWGFLTNYTGIENTTILGHSSGRDVAGIICATGGQQQDIRVIKLTNATTKTLLGTIAQSEISSASSVITMARMDGRMYVLVDDVIKFTVSASDFNSTANLASVWSFGRGTYARKFITPKYRSGMTSIKGLTGTTVNATGNFIGNTITAPSSTSSMGAIITYEDTSGTNALNTDIVLQLSADNGSNFTTATLTALPNFSTGIKMAKVNNLTVTAGTQLKYKISFANQSSGSKEARIKGVSLQY